MVQFPQTVLCCVRKLTRYVCIIQVIKYASVLHIIMLSTINIKKLYLTYKLELIFIQP